MTTSDHELAAELAHSAGQLLLALRDEIGVGDPTLKDEGDRRSNRHLLAGLAAVRPDDAILSEESPDDDVRLAAPRVWIIDPLDGTREYSEGRADWAVHVALWEGTRLTAGAVALPGAGAVHATQPVTPVAPANGGPVRLVVSRTRPLAQATALADILGGELVAMGSAGAKAMAVLRGEADVYAHAGGQYEWDSAAPVAVALAAGLHCSRIDGSPLVYNQPSPWMPDLLICRPELADQVLRGLAGMEV